jgi:hypothetical protein
VGDGLGVFGGRRMFNGCGRLRHRFSQFQKSRRLLRRSQSGSARGLHGAYFHGKRKQRIRHFMQPDRGLGRGFLGSGRDVG